MKIDIDNKDLYIKELFKFFAVANIVTLIVSICMAVFFQLTEDLPWSMMGEGLLFVFGVVNAACVLTIVVIPILNKLKLIES